jgi:prophage regulatory protein
MHAHKPISVVEGVRVMRLREVCTRTGLCVATVYRLARDGKFPRPLKLTGERASGWLSTEIDEYISGLVAQRAKAATAEATN